MGRGGVTPPTPWTVPLDPAPASVERFAADPACAGLDVTVAATLEEALDGAEALATGPKHFDRAFEIEERFA